MKAPPICDTKRLWNTTNLQNSMHVTNNKVEHNTPIKILHSGNNGISEYVHGMIV